MTALQTTSIPRPLTGPLFTLINCFILMIATEIKNIASLGYDSICMHIFTFGSFPGDQVLANDEFSVYLSLLSYPLIYYPGAYPPACGRVDTPMQS